MTKKLFLVALVLCLAVALQIVGTANAGTEFTDININKVAYKVLISKNFRVLGVEVVNPPSGAKSCKWAKPNKACYILIPGPPPSAWTDRMVIELLKVDKDDCVCCGGTCYCH